MEIGVLFAVLLAAAEVFKFRGRCLDQFVLNSSLWLCLVLNLLPILCELLPIASYRFCRFEARRD
jgi:hypothetical protein